MNKITARWIHEHCNGKSVTLSSKTRLLHPFCKEIIANLSKISVINFIKVTPDSVFASNEISGYHEVPVSRPEHPTAIGVHVVLDFKHNLIEFVEINSAIKGYGQKMVSAVMGALPKDWQPTVVFDHSDGFWDKMKKEFAEVEWLEI